MIDLARRLRAQSFRWEDAFARGDLQALSAALSGGVIYECVEWLKDSKITHEARSKYGAAISVLIVAAAFCIAASVGGLALSGEGVSGTVSDGPSTSTSANPSTATEHSRGASDGTAPIPGHRYIPRSVYYDAAWAVMCIVVAICAAGRSSSIIQKARILDLELLGSSMPTPRRAAE